MKKMLIFLKLKQVPTGPCSHLVEFDNLMTFLGLKTAKIQLLDPDPYSESRRRFESGSNPDPQH